MKIIKTIFLIVFCFLFLIIIRISIASLLDQKIFSLIDKQNISSERPQNRDSCIKKGGEWRRPGPWPKEICMMKNKDGGKFCLAGFQCESGKCIARLTNLRNPPWFATGQCPQYKILFGCLQEVHFGIAGQSVCLD